MPSNTNDKHGSEVEADKARDDDKPKYAGKEWPKTDAVKDGERFGDDRDTNTDLRPGGNTSSQTATDTHGAGAEGREHTRQDPKK
jgi:hypothetical protein